MKNFIIVVVFALSIATIKAQEKINWISLNKALELQKKKPKKIIMDVYTNWCGVCKMLDKNTFSNKDVIKYINKNYYAVKFNAEGNETIKFDNNTFKNPDFNDEKMNRKNSSHEFTIYMGINSFPTIVFLNDKGGLIAPVPGYQTPQQLEFFLKIFAKSKYKEMTSKEKFLEFHKKFKPTFK